MQACRQELCRKLFGEGAHNLNLTRALLFPIELCLAKSGHTHGFVRTCEYPTPIN